jgi:hypothetical protein
MISLLSATVLASLKPTGTRGPFGLAFPATVRGDQLLSCESVRGRPFVTGLRVQRVRAPLSGREAYEFRIQCGPANSSWSVLGPPLLPWAEAQEGGIACPRPQSATGMLVSRGRREWWRERSWLRTLEAGSRACSSAKRVRP